MEFKKQFKAKAGVNWEDRQGMTAKKGGPLSFFILSGILLWSAPGKYMWLGTVVFVLLVSPD